VCQWPHILLILDCILLIEWLMQQKFISHSFGIKVSIYLVVSVSCFLATFSVCSCSSYKGTDPYPMTSLKAYCLLKTLSPNTVMLGKGFNVGILKGHKYPVFLIFIIFNYKEGCNNWTSLSLFLMHIHLCTHSIKWLVRNIFLF
jgi:hypothetical protein